MGIVVPSRMSDVELKAYIAKFIEDCYSEIDRYLITVDEDFLTTGVDRFVKKLGMARGYANRVLGMVADARRLKNAGQALEKGKKRLIDERIFEHIEKNRASMKGLDASERKLKAGLACRDTVRDHEEWEALVRELNSLIEILDDRQRDLLNARHDMRAVLWAVKLQGILGELGKEAQEESVSAGSALMSGTVHEHLYPKVGEFVPPVPYTGGSDLQDPQPPVSGAPLRDPRVDELLGLTEKP